MTDLSLAQEADLFLLSSGPSREKPKNISDDEDLDLPIEPPVRDQSTTTMYASTISLLTWL